MGKKYKAILEDRKLFKTIFIILFIIFCILLIIFVTIIFVTESRKEYYDFGGGMKISKQDMESFISISEGKPFRLCSIELGKCISISSTRNSLPTFSAVNF